MATKKSAKRPFIAYYFDALEEAEAAARAARVDPDLVIAGLVRMWRHCWRKKTIYVTAEELGQFFAGADARLRQALGADFLQLDVEIDDAEAMQFSLGGRTHADLVRGAEQYLRIREARSKGGHAAKGNLKRGKQPGSSPASAGDQPEEAPGCAPALTSSSDQRAASLDPAAKPLDQPHSDLEHHHAGDDGKIADELWQSICARRADEGLPRELSPPKGFESFVRAAIAEGFDPMHLQVGHAAYLVDKHFELAGWPTAVFITPNVWRPRSKAPPRRARDSLTGIAEAYA